MSVFAPFGFRPYNSESGGSPTAQVRQYKMAYNVANTFTGDPVEGVADGTVVRVGTVTTGAKLVGIAVGFSWVSVAQNKRVWAPYYVSSDAASASSPNVDVLVIDDPESVFVVQCGPSNITTGVAFADIFANCTFAYGTGSTLTGQSGAYLDMTTNPPAATQAFPFKIIDVVPFPPGSQGVQTVTGTTPFSYAVVKFNNMMLRNLGTVGI